MRRRDLLRGAVAAGLGATAGRLLGARGFALPAAIPSELPATPATIAVWPNLPTTLFTYDGVYPSPTIRARRGDLVDILVENTLPEETNVHWHGLSVPAMADGHPMDVIAPGASRQYTFQVLDRAGTYWYHPHPDRKTASQVYRGMAGFFIVGDADEDALGLPTGAYDVPLLLQDRVYRTDGSFTYAPTMMDLMTGYLGDVALVNGVPDARMSVAAAAYRFRLLNGSNARVFKVAFEDLRTFQVIGGDGGLLEGPVPATSLFLSPGERADIYVDFSRSSSLRPARLVSLAFNTVAGRMGPGRGAGGAAQGDPMTLLTLHPSGTTGPTPPLPLRLVPLDPLGPPVVQRQFTMDMLPPPVFGNFTINGLAYDPNRVDVRADRGVQERWVVTNASAEPHPFHVHATQFRVISRSSGPLGPHELALKDTVLVWPGEVVQLAVRFEHHAGIYVFHCHNLEHEDMGMMATLEVL